MNETPATRNRRPFRRVAIFAIVCVALVCVVFCFSRRYFYDLVALAIIQTEGKCIDSLRIGIDGCTEKDIFFFGFDSAAWSSDGSIVLLVSHVGWRGNWEGYLNISPEDSEKFQVYSRGAIAELYIQKGGFSGTVFINKESHLGGNWYPAFYRLH